jgi:hypothetical protein
MTPPLILIGLVMLAVETTARALSEAVSRADGVAR